MLEQIPEWGVDNHIQPNAGLSEKVAVLSLSGKHTLRLLQETNPKIAGLALPTNRPLAAAGGLDFVALINAATPWVEFGIDSAKLPPDSRPSKPASMPRSALEVLKCYRGTLAVSIPRGNVTATAARPRSEFHDIQVGCGQRSAMPKYRTMVGLRGTRPHPVQQSVHALRDQRRIDHLEP